jgi:hypothetical protein
MVEYCSFQLNLLKIEPRLVAVMNAESSPRRRIADPGRNGLEHLSDEDLAFVRRFVLASGSLKEMARIYGVSYPTVRLRLDRLIDKLRALDDSSVSSELERVARALFAEGRLDVETLKALMHAHRRDLETAAEGGVA